MSKFLFNVANVWQERAGIVVISDLPDVEIDFRHGDLLELRLPDGRIIQAAGGAVLFDPPADRPLGVAFKDLSPDDVPVGTEVWLVQTERKPWKPDRRWKPANQT